MHASMHWLCFESGFLQPPVSFASSLLFLQSQPFYTLLFSPVLHPANHLPSLSEPLSTLLFSHLLLSK